MTIFQRVLLIVLTLVASMGPTLGFSLFGFNFGRKEPIHPVKIPDAISTKSTSPKAPSCIACYGDMNGHEINRLRYGGFTDQQRDISCRDKCLADHRCEFWVRSTKSSDCSLKQGFRSYVDMEPTQDKRGGFRRPEDELGVVFIKQPKTGGETLAEILAQYSVKYGRKVLHETACINNRNPMGQSTCACDIHFVRNSQEALPTSDPLELPRFTMLYTHMFYSPAVLSYFMPPTIKRRLITVIRHPVEVLKSAQKMALLQKHLKGNTVNNSFCQPLADDMELWLTKCPMAAEGVGSILNYMDVEGHAALTKLLKAAKGRLASVDEDAARNTLTRAKQRLQDDFIIGMQSDFDLSMILFEAALGWDRSDSLYSSESMVMHSSRSHPLAKKLDHDWENNRYEMIELMKRRYSPIQYHIELYRVGVNIHRQQVEQYLGDHRQVELALEMYRLQNSKFTVCYENHKKSHPFRTCSQQGLWDAAKARHVCGSAMKGLSEHPSRGSV